MTAHERRQLPVLDIEEGIARLMGNRRVYFNALKRFAGYADAARAVVAQLEAGDHAGALRAVHTLKGAAGLLCAAEVQAIAAQVEAALAHGHAVHTLMEDLHAALQRVQGYIDMDLAKEAAVPARFVPPPAIANVQELLDRLDALLDEGNGNAIDLVDRYGPVLEKALGTAAWQSVAAGVGDYDFERALAALRNTRSAMR